MAQPDTDEWKARRIEGALKQNALIDEAIAHLREFKSSNIKSAANRDGWCNLDLHKALVALHRAMETDSLEAAIKECADALLSDHRWDVEAGCVLPREAA